MSVQAMAWVLERSQSTGNDRLVLLAIANHAHVDGTGAWPSIPTIAREARVSERTARRTIRRLAELGELKIVERGGGDERVPDRYRPHLYTLTGVSTDLTDWQGSGVTPWTVSPDTSDRSDRSPVAGKPSLEPNKNLGGQSVRGEMPCPTCSTIGGNGLLFDPDTNTAGPCPECGVLR